jgi:hypothetical protein
MPGHVGTAPILIGVTAVAECPRLHHALRLLWQSGSIPAK